MKSWTICCATRSSRTTRRPSRRSTRCGRKWNECTSAPPLAPGSAAGRFPFEPHRSRPRLLLDSPAALDPELKGLLDDLELVLAQIARLPARPRGGRDASRSELELITRSLEQHDVVPRLRSAAAGLANSLPSGSSDD